MIEALGQVRNGRVNNKKSTEDKCLTKVQYLKINNDQHHNKCNKAKGQEYKKIRLRADLEDYTKCQISQSVSVRNAVLEQEMEMTKKWFKNVVKLPSGSPGWMSHISLVFSYIYLVLLFLLKFYMYYENSNSIVIVKINEINTRVM